jgi:sugar/nucleoside kinase (ribokinase family)
MLDLICLGNLTIDDIVLPDGRTNMGSFGGDAIYAALGASYWCNRVGFVAPIGTDFPQEHLSKLQAAGWDTSGLANRELPSIRNWVVYEGDGRRTWILRSDPGDFLELSPRFEDIPDGFRSARAALLLAMDLTAQDWLVSQLKAPGKLVALDPQEDYIAGNQGRIFEMLSSVDIFLPSSEEVYRLTGSRDYEKAAIEFTGYGCRIVVVKLGAEGSLIYERSTNQFWRIPAYPVTVIDTTGAGDAYCGGFIAMYIKTHDLERSGLAGAVSASFAVESMGLDSMLQIKPGMAAARLANWDVEGKGTGLEPASSSG